MTAPERGAERGMLPGVINRDRAYDLCVNDIFIYGRRIWKAAWRGGKVETLTQCINQIMTKDNPAPTARQETGEEA